jgi:hypothetical protein
MRLALILIVAAALPGAVRRIDEFLVGRAPATPVARWRVVETPPAAPRTPRVSPTMVHVEMSAPVIERVRVVHPVRVTVPAGCVTIVADVMSGCE